MELPTLWMGIVLEQGGLNREIPRVSAAGGVHDLVHNCTNDGMTGPLFETRSAWNNRKKWKTDTYEKGSGLWNPSWPDFCWTGGLAAVLSRRDPMVQVSLPCTVLRRRSLYSFNCPRIAASFLSEPTTRSVMLLEKKQGISSTSNCSAYRWVLRGQDERDGRGEKGVIRTFSTPVSPAQSIASASLLFRRIASPSRSAAILTCATPRRPPLMLTLSLGAWAAFASSVPGGCPASSVRPRSSHSLFLPPSAGWSGILERES